MQIEGKVAVITGAGSGIGRSMATLFAKQGARIAAGDWHSDTLAEVVAEVGADGGEILGQVGDISEQGVAEQLVDAAVEQYGRLDVLCNVAGVIDLNQGVGEMTNEQWQRVMGINLNGVMFTCRRAVQIMREQKAGSIINVASAAGLGGGVHGTAYTVSKAGVISLSKNIAWYYLNEGIRCNAICPGGTVTNIGTSADSSQMDPFGLARVQLVYQTLPDPWLDPIDIAQLALFLAADVSKGINGAVISADRGWRAI